MARGYVKWFDDSKGFGFIAQFDPGQPDVYVHHSRIIDQGLGHTTLVEGLHVEFEVDHSPLKGPQAIEVRCVVDADAAGYGPRGRGEIGPDVFAYTGSGERRG
ncbi:cold shock CspA family protein [Nocardia sp. GAS34]